MSKNNENKLVPKLRFPEFSNTENWVVCDLIDTADKKIKWSFTGGPFGSNLKAEDYTETGIRIIQLQNIGDGEFIDDYKIYTSEEKANELLSCNIYSGEIILSKMGDPVGRACLIPEHLERCLLASDGIRLVVDEKRFSKLFVYSLINSKQIRDAIERKATGSTRKRIGLDELKKTNLPTPIKLVEQQKIAACLSSLDEVITAESQKLDVLKEHKKGMLQNLFPQAGETVPKLRFKEFENEWKKAQLGILMEIKGRIGYRGYTTNDIVDKGEGAISLSPSNIDANNRLNFDKATYISWEKYFESPEIMLQDGFTVLVKTGSSFGKAVYIKNLPEKTTINPQLVVMKPTNINSKFLFLIVCNFSIQKQIKEHVVGGAIPTLSQESISKFEILIPPDIEKKEQEKIADTLSSIDDLITAQNQKIELLKQHKKGLLQGLFPAVNPSNSMGLESGRNWPV